MANLMLGVTLQWTGIPSAGEVERNALFRATENGDKNQLDGQLALFCCFYFSTRLSPETTMPFTTE